MKAILTALALPVLALLLGVTSPVLAADWTIDAAQSHLKFQGTLTGDESFEGEFEAFTAEIHFDPADLASSSARVVVDLTSAKSGDRQRDSFMQLTTWFDPKAESTAVFQTTAFQQLADGSYTADGTLTLKGTTLPISLPFTLVLDGNTAKVDGSLMLNRNDYNVGDGQYAAGKWVGLDVNVIIDLVATK